MWDGGEHNHCDGYLPTYIMHVVRAPFDLSFHEEVKLVNLLHSLI